MPRSSLIEVTWQDADARGYTDVLPIEAFERVGDAGVIVHDVRGPASGWSSAKCRVAVREMSADLDYEHEVKFNRSRGMDLGVMRLLFGDADRTKVTQVQWKKIGQKTFVAAKFKSQRYKPATPPAYQGPGKQSKKALRAVLERPGQIKFRRGLRLAYGNRCSISGCQVPQALDGAHIDPFTGPSSDNLKNGILLRRDLHSLFDANLLGINPLSLRVYFAPETLWWPEYKRWHRLARLRVPETPECRPSDKALKRRWQRFLAVHRGALSGKRKA